MIKPIETIYKGYRFRSRLEARWAVFFDTLGIQWEYEKEGYSIDGVFYLSDFWLPEYSYWFEVKGKELTKEEYIKACKLCDGSRNSVLIAIGEIKIPPADLNIVPPIYEEYKKLLTETMRYTPGSIDYTLSESWWYPPERRFDTYTWLECPICHEIQIYDQQCVYSCPSDWYQGASPRIVAAYTAARQARFEYGEHGA